MKVNVNSSDTRTKVDQKYECISNPGGGDCAVYAIIDALKIIGHPSVQHTNRDITSDITNIRQQICKVTSSFFPLYQLEKELSKGKSEDSEQFQQRTSKINWLQLKYYYIDIFGDQHFEIFRSLILNEINDKLNVNDINKESYTSFSNLKAVIENINSWDNITIEIAKDIFCKFKTFDINIKSTLQDHNQHLTSKITFENYYDFASKQGVWLNNSEISAYLLILGFRYKNKLSINDETYILYENLQNQILCLNNDGQDNHNNLSSNGTHWQAVKIDSSVYNLNDSKLHIQVQEGQSTKVLPKYSISDVDIQNKKFMNDNEKLNHIVQLIDNVNEQLSEKDYLNDLNQIGQLIHDIGWNEKDLTIVRNKHGYRNRSISKCNEKNTDYNSAKINFEIISTLKDLSVDDNWNWLLTTNRKLLTNGLAILKNKIKFILNLEGINANFADDNIGCFSKIVIFYHDYMRIKNLIELFNNFKTEWYNHLDLNIKTDKYALSFLILRIGETAKEISDVIKFEKDKEINLLKELFNKIGKYRDEIKNKPYIVHGNNISHLLRMKETIDKISENFINLLNDLMKDAFYPYNIGSARETIVTKINNEYGLEISKILNPITNILQDLLKNFTVGLIDPIKKKLKLEKEIGVTENLLKKLVNELNDTEIKILNHEKNQNNIKKSVDNCFHKLVSPILHTKLAKQVVHIVNSIPKTKLEGDPDVSQEEKEFLCLIRTNSSSISKTAIERKDFLKLFRKYKFIVDGTIAKFNKLNNTNFDYNIIKQFLNIEKQSTLEDLKNSKNLLEEKLKFHEQKIGCLKEELQNLNKSYSSASRKINKENVKVNEENKDKNNETIIGIINEIKFLQELFIELNYEKSKSKHLTSNYTKLVFAEKMAFGFLGQYYKLAHGTKLIDEYTIENSILSDYIFDVIQVRHKHIAHNTLSKISDAEITSTIELKISPWLKDFQYMARLILEKNYSTKEVSEITPQDEHLINNYRQNSFSDANQKLFYQYNKLVALNRFLRNKEAITEYLDIKNKLDDYSDQELVTEIHWQGSLAYRNSNKFNECSEALKLALIAGEQIKDINIRGFKICGLKCDLGIALVELDKLDEANLNLFAVTSDLKFATTRQIIGANFLIANIDLLKGKILVGQSKLELTFVKYFNTILKSNSVLSLSILNQLAEYYLNHYLIKNARDCLDYAEQILKENFHHYIQQDGQHVVYHKCILQYTLIKYDILKTLSSNTKLNQNEIVNIYNNLIRTNESISALPYLTNTSNEHMMQLVVLCGEHQAVDKMIEVLLPYKTVDKKESFIVIKKNIKLMKKEIFDFHHLYEDDPAKDNTMLQSQRECKHQLKLKKYLDEIVATLKELSYQSFSNKEFALSKEYMKKAISYTFLIDYLEYEFEYAYDAAVQKLSIPGRQLQIHRIQDILIEWLDSTLINDSALINFSHKKLNNISTDQNFVNVNKSLVTQYLQKKDNPSELKDLVDLCEVNLMASQYFEDGSLSFFTKLQEDEGLLKHRFFAEDDLGLPVIKERAYKLSDEKIKDIILETFENGLKAYKENHHELAIEYYGKALKLHSKLENPNLFKKDIDKLVMFYNRARAYENNKEFDLAQKDFEEILKVKVDHSKARQGIERCINALKNEDSRDQHDRIIDELSLLVSNSHISCSNFEEDIMLEGINNAIKSVSISGSGADF